MHIPEDKLIGVPLPEDEPFDNVDTIRETLESGDESRLARLLIYIEKSTGKPMTREQLDFYRHFAVLRKRIIDRGRQQLIERREHNPTPTDIERHMGIYVEQVEEPVRDAVVGLNRKGYSTRASGFAHELNSQFILFKEGSGIENYKPSSEVLKQLESLGARFNTSEIDYISFTADKVLDEKEIKLLWDAIAEDVPPREQPQEPNKNSTKYFERFTKKKN